MASPRPSTRGQTILVAPVVLILLCIVALPPLGNTRNKPTAETPMRALRGVDDPSKEPLERRPTSRSCANGEETKVPE